MRRLDRHIPLSALWLFVLLNIIFHDTRQFVLASRIEMQLTDYYNGIKITEGLMLLGGFLVQVLIVMVLFSLLVTRRIGRPVTFLAAIIATGMPHSHPPPPTWMTPFTPPSRSRL